MVDRSQKPKVGNFPKLIMPPADIVTLPHSGMSINVIAGEAYGMTKITIIMDGGSLDCDNPALPAISYAMTREGTKSHTAAEIAEIFDTSGAWLTFEPSDHRQTITLLALGSQTPKLLSLLAEMLSESLFENEPLERIKLREAKALESKRLKVEYQAEIGLRPLAYGPSHPAVDDGSVERIMEVTSEQCRRYAQSQSQAYPAGVVVAGSIDDSVLKAIDLYFMALLKPGAQSAECIYTPYRPEASGIARRVISPSPQSAIEMAIPVNIDRFHDDYPDLRMSVTALGGYFGSRLMSRIRERSGLCYGISSSLLVSREGAYISISTTAANGKEADVISQCREEIADLSANPPQGFELDTLRNQIATHYARMLDTTFTRGAYYSLFHTIDIPDDYFKRLQDGLARLCGDTIAQASERYIKPDKLLISIAGEKP